MKKILIYFIATLMLNCQPLSNNQSTFDYRETPKPIGSEYCSKAEEHLQQMCNVNQVENTYCCDVVKPTLKGKSFTQFCQETQANGISLAPNCLSQIIKCEDVDVCIGTKR